MILYSFKHTIRNIKASGLYSLINILGLTLGIFCTLVLAKYILHEWTTDHFHSKQDRLALANIQGTPMSMPELFAPRVFFKFDYTNYSQVENACKLHFYKNEPVIVEQNEFRADLLIADSTFFQLFDFELQGQSPKGLLALPETIIISQKLASRLFGSADPIGKRIKFEGKDFEVKALLEDLPNNSSMEFDAIISSEAKRFWSRSGFDVVLLHDIAQISQLNEQLADAGKDHPQFTESTLSYKPFKGVYFDRSFDLNDELAHGNLQSIRILFLIACLILAICLFNFINLYSVILLKRTKDLGIQKVMGAGRKDLIWEFICENFISACIAVSLSFILMELFSPLLQNYTGKSIHLQLSQDIWLFGGMITFLTLLTSIYPIIRYPNINPIQAIQATINSKTPLGLRKLMMTGQYIATIVLLIVSMFFIKQLNFMLNKDLGFNSGQVIKIRFFSEIPRVSRQFDENWEEIENSEREAYLAAVERQRKTVQYVTNEISNNPDIQFLSFGNSPLAKWESSWKHTGEGFDYHTVPSMNLTTEFDSLFELTLVEGRFFNTELDRSRENKVVINEAAKRFFEIDDIDDAFLSNRYWGDDEEPFKIIGVIQDYHFQHLSQSIQPLVMYYWNDRIGSYFMMRLHPQKEAESIAYLEDLFAEVNLNRSFEYSFVEDDVAAMYKEDKQVAQIYTAFTFIALLISSLGLFGISLYDVQQRIKEIGIRKVAGASTEQIIGLLTKGFGRLIFIAFVVACPVAYFAINKYLEDFATKAEISWWLFAGAGIFTALLAAATLIWHTFRAANAQPADALRYE